MGAGILLGDEGRGGGTELRQGGGFVPAGEESTQNAGDVTVEGGCGDMESDTGDGAGGVGSDAGELLEFLGVGRKLAGGEAEDGFGERMKITSPTIVAEPLPVAENEGLGGASEGGPGGEATKPTVVVGKNGGDAGLLAHEFGDGDMVGGGRGAPGERSLMVAEPAVEEGKSAMDFRIDERAGGPRVQGHGGHDVYP